MPPSLRVSAVLMTLAALAACSRLTFVRPDLGRRGPQHVAETVEIRETRASRSAAEARRQLLLAQQRVVAGDLDAAEKAARQAVKLAPRMAEAHDLLAAVLTARGRDDDAGAHHRIAVELAPERGETLNNYGVWLCAHDRPGESLAWFERALADPAYRTPASAQANLGACAYRAGDAVRAERELRRAIELDPANALALGTLARIEYEAGRFLTARAFSERRLAAAPADAEALQLASQIERALGDNRAAERYVQRMGAEFPRARDSKQGAESKP